jgi:hypothetical protein
MDMIERTNKTSRRQTNQKGLRRISLVFVCIIFVLAGWKCPQINNLGKYFLNVFFGNYSDTRDINEANWAKKIELSGVSNLHKVSDDLYRGAQPTEEGMKE